MYHPALFDIALKRYVERILVPKLDLRAVGYRIVIPHTGVKSCVRRLEFANDLRIVVRCYTQTEKKNLRPRLLADEIFEKHQLPAPRIIDYREQNERPRFIFIAEEEAPGRHLIKGPFPRELIAPLAQCLAAFHAVRAPLHGPLGKPIGGPFFDAFSRRVKNRLSTLRRYSSKSFEKPLLKPARRWFSRWRDNFAPISIFDLVHGSLNPGNLVWDDAQKRFFLIDFATINFGCKAKDVVQAEHELFSGDDAPAIQKEFRETYIGLLPRVERQQFESVEPFFHAYFHLGQCAISLRRESKKRRLQRNLSGGEYTKFIAHWRILLSFFEPHHPAAQLCAFVEQRGSAKPIAHPQS